MLAAAVAICLWGLAVAALSGMGAARARSGAERVRELDRTAGVAELFSGSVTEELERAHTELGEASRLLGNPILAPARLLPVAGRQLRTAQALADTAEDVLDAATDAAAVVSPRPGDPPVTATNALDTLTLLQTELAAVRAALADADLGPSDALIGPLDRARRDLVDTVDRAQEVAGDLDAVLDGMHRLLTGPSRYVVVGANNAEMRVGSGMFLSIGAVDLTDGDLTVARRFTPAPELVLPERVPLPPEISHLWGWSGVGGDWRSLALSGRFPVNAALGAEMWSQWSADPADGVFALDLVALHSILEITGPIEVDGEQIRSDDVVDLLLREQYRDADDRTANAVRRERLSELGGVALDALGDTSLNLRALFDAFRPARDGRHLMAWSSDPVVQRAWELLDLDGDLDTGSLLLGLANIDGSKLDPYVEVHVTASTRRSGQDTEVQLEIDITNRAPDGLPGYVVGTDASPAYRGLLSVHLPQTARASSLSGFDDVVAAGPDGPTAVLAATVTVAQDETRRGHVRFTVPRGTRVDVEPSARLPPTQWTSDGQTRSDDVRWRLALPDG